MKENEVLRGFPKHLEKVERIKLGNDTIDYLMLNLPPFCNYQCKKCLTNANNRKIRDSLTADEITGIIGKAQELGAKVVGITGEGEPLINKSLERIVEYVNNRKMIPFVATNGSLLDKKTSEFLAGQNATITISLDTMDKKAYNESCGVNCGFETVIHNIEYARDVFKEQIRQVGKYRVMRLAVHMVITSENMDQITKIKEVCGEDILFSCDYMADIGEALKNPELSIKKEQLERIISDGSEKIVLAKAGERDVCGLFFYGLAVGHSGDVLVDAHAVDSEGLLGNVRNDSLNKLAVYANMQKRRFYKDFGSCYCIVRDQKYQDFLESLRH